MKAWKKGAIVGFIWSMLIFVISPYNHFFVFFYLPYIFTGYLTFFSGPLIGTLIGAGVGYSIDSNMKAWKKGAIVGGIWGSISLFGFLSFASSGINAPIIPNLIDKILFAPGFLGFEILETLKDFGILSYAEILYSSPKFPLLGYIAFLIPTLVGAFMGALIALLIDKKISMRKRVL